jgi:peroxiredoxin (alkyl hydroperoxide reductase subunit C)
MPNLVATKAPEFETEGVQNGEFKPVKLSDYRGKWTLLFFYPLDFTFVCPTELLALSEHYDEFKKLGVEILGCSVDSKFSHLNWMKQEIRTRHQGVIHASKTWAGGRRDVQRPERNGGAARHVPIDPQGVVQHCTISNLSVGRSIEETLRVVQTFQWVASHTGEVCPMDWKPGATTMAPTEEGSASTSRSRWSAA